MSCFAFEYTGKCQRLVFERAESERGGRGRRQKLRWLRRSSCGFLCRWHQLLTPVISGGRSEDFPLFLPVSLTLHPSLLLIFFSGLYFLLFLHLSFWLLFCYFLVYSWKFSQVSWEESKWFLSRGEDLSFWWWNDGERERVWDRETNLRGVLVSHQKVSRSVLDSGRKSPTTGSVETSEWNLIPERSCDVSSAAHQKQTWWTS